LGVRLVQNIQLFFREGKSDKVYEVDLCEVGPNQFVVNFRYGRRGSKLREGTRTSSPVSRDEAVAIYNDLVVSKTKKGYRETEGAPATQPTPVVETVVTKPDTPETDPRAESILARLRERNSSKRNWPLSRAIWRAGEIGLVAAEPLIQACAGEDDITEYSVAWALGRLGQVASLPALRSIANNQLRQAHVRQIAREGMRRIADDETRSAMIQEVIEQLPQPLQRFATTATPEVFRNVLSDRLALNDSQDVALLSNLYFIDSEIVRPALLSVLAEIPLRVPYFASIRRIFKAAEFRLDAEVFGLLAHRFETSKHNFRTGFYYGRGKYRHPAVGENPKNAFSAQTRLFLRQRTWSTLSRMGKLSEQLGATSYVRMAVGVLLPFTDDDAFPMRTDRRYVWERRSWEETYRGEYSPYWAFNQILYGNSARFTALQGNKTFRYADGHKPTDAAPLGREEAFHELWKQEPRGLLHLLTESRCRPVHEFAVKTIRECTEFCAALDVPVIKILLSASYDVTVEFGFELAVKRYDPNRPDADLLLTMANAKLEKARSQAHRWIADHQRTLYADVNFAFGMLTSDFADTRQTARDALHAFPADANSVRSLAGRLIAFLLQLSVEPEEIIEAELVDEVPASASANDAAVEEDADDAVATLPEPPPNSPLARDITETLLQSYFAEEIAQLGEEVIVDLIQHQIAEVQAFAGEVLLRHRTLSQNPTEAILRQLLDATHPPVRAVGVRLISQLPDDVLTGNINLLAELTRHPHANIRQEIRPVVLRLIESHEQFARDLASELIRRLQIPGAAKGIPTYTSRVLREDFGRFLSHISSEEVWRLLQSRSAPAQEVGGFLLGGNVAPESLTMENIARLASHDILTVRQAAWKMITEQPDRVKAELPTVVRILDSRWDDTRQFAFEYMKSNLTENDLTPDSLISICDSVREDVQQFGRGMITKIFRNEDGPHYLLRLSEHPSMDMQLFASNLLVEYGTDYVDRLQQLTPFFVSILSRVNRGRVAKQRVLRFLTEEAEKSLQQAKICSEILARISATCAIGDRAATIEAMVMIRERFPNEIDLPISIKPLEVR